MIFALWKAETLSKILFLWQVKISTISNVITSTKGQLNLMLMSIKAWMNMNMFTMWSSRKSSAEEKDNGWDTETNLLVVCFISNNHGGCPNNRRQQLIQTPLLIIPCILMILDIHWCGMSTGEACLTWMCRTELQRRSLKVLETRSLKSLLKVWYLYQVSTTLGLEPVSIVHYTRPGSSIKRPIPNYLAPNAM